MKSTFRILFYAKWEASDDAKMLGHTKLTTTQIYARIVDQTVSRKMDRLSATLSGTSFSLNGGDSSTQETTNE